MGFLDYNGDEECDWEAYTRREMGEAGDGPTTSVDDGNCDSEKGDGFDGAVFSCSGFGFCSA